MTSQKWLVLGLLLTLQPVSHALAGKGGEGSGGGHEIEAGFKTKLISLAKEAQDMLPEQKHFLKFDADTFAARLTIPNGLSPLCAAGDELTQLRQLNKMAYVSNPSSGVVNLNCSDYSLSQWQSLFDSQEMGNKVFFIHEGLRILETENENDYSISSSFSTALRADPQYEAKTISITMEHLLSALEGSKCSLRIPARYNPIFVFFNGSLRDEVEFVINDKTVDSVSTRCLYYEEEFRTSLIQIGPVSDLRKTCGRSDRYTYNSNEYDNEAMNKFRARVAARAVREGCL